MMSEKNNFYNTEIGLDKIKLCCFYLKIKDLKKLYDNPNCSININSIHKRKFIINGQSYNIGSISITDPLFKLKIDTRYTNNSNHNYQVIELNPARILFGENIRNVSTPDQLSECIENIEQELLKNYGIEIDLNTATIKSLEINKNISLNYNFSSYENVFNIISKNLPKTFKPADFYDNDKLTTGFKAENGSISLKFYDKLVERNKNSDLNLLRIEYELKNKYKVKNTLGFNKLAELLDNFEKIIESFNCLLNKHIVKPSTYRLDKLYKNIVKTLKTYKKTNRSYLKITLASLQDDEIFDYEFLFKALSKLNLCRSSLSKGRKQAKELLTSRDTNGANFFFNNIKKYNEIMQGLELSTFEL